VDAELQGIVREMFERMYASGGIGLAANQVNLPIRLFVMNLEGDPAKGEELVFLNPVISHPRMSTECSRDACNMNSIISTGRCLLIASIRHWARN
jgi:peptide deformylase